MKDIRNAIEGNIESFCRQIIRFRLPVLVGVLLVSTLFAYQIRLLEVDTSNEGFLHEDDHILQRYNQFRDQFGRDDLAVVAIASEDIFSIQFLQKLQSFHDRLWQDVPYVNDITSLVNVRNTRGAGDVLYVDDLLADFPQDSEDLKLLRNQVMNNPLYRHQLISDNGRFTTIIIEGQVYGETEEVDLLGGFEEIAGPADSAPAEYLSDKQNSEFVRAISSLVREYNSSDFRMYLAGTPVVTDTVKRLMMQDMKKFIRLALLIIAFCLYIMFRRISGVLLPLLTVVLSFVTILGMMATLNVSFKLPTTILPSFLLAVGVGASVHVLSLTFQGIRRGCRRNQAIAAAFGHSGVAICITSLTTAAGLASFSLAKVAPIADLGLFSAVGVMISLFYTMTFLPALLSFIPIERKKMPEPDNRRAMD
ncbi:MAG: MMPL family transporter, partial [Desulfocapsaceae bacterium]|nr:MMPL family transporter [Desulfocapsaceae bacterium]